MDCSPSSLIPSAACLMCLTEAQLKWVKTYLLCQMALGGVSGPQCAECLFKFTQDVFTNSHNEDDLYTASIPGNTLIVDGQSLFAHWSGTGSGIAGTLSAYFAGNQLIPLSPITPAAASRNGWKVIAFVFRDSISTARCTCVVSSTSGPVRDNETNLVGIDWTIPNILKVTGHAGGGTSITAKLGYIDLHN